MRRRGEASSRWRITGSALVLLAGITGPIVRRVLSEPSLPVVRDATGRILGVTRESTGAVTVTLTPTRHTEGKLFVDFVIRSLVKSLERYDLKKIVTLSFDGQNISPSAAPKLRGRRSSGELVFPLLVMPSSFAIKIYGLDQPALRVLSWPIDVWHKAPVGPHR